MPQLAAGTGVLFPTTLHRKLKFSLAGPGSNSSYRIYGVCGKAGWAVTFCRSLLPAGLLAGSGFLCRLRYLLQVIVVARTTQVVLAVPVESFETTVQLPSADGVMVENPKPLTEVVSTTVAPPMSMPAPGTVVGCEARLSPLFPMISCGARAGEKSNVWNVCVWPDRIS